MFAKALRQLVRARAGNRCEYCLCHQDHVMAQLHIDHIVPAAKGGTGDPDNLCLACELCNLHKWTKIEGLDPQTGKIVGLFNPRRERWADHFSWSEDGAEIVGLTATGRATVNALRLNSPLAVTVRKNWVKAGWHPPQI